MERWLSIDDDELAALALAADPEQLLNEDALSLEDGRGAGLLPGWYMPAPMSGLRPLRGWRRWLCLLIIASFVLINAYGLCSTYGHVGLG
jgi:hypothetical protein